MSCVFGGGERRFEFKCDALFYEALRKDVDNLDITLNEEE
jgi:hypothetical protein